MRVSCLQENLSRGMSIVGRAVMPRSTMPVLGNILMATDEGRLRLAATNLEIGITCWIGAMVEDDGAVTIPARLLSDFVSQLPAERIDMDYVVRIQMLNLKCARYDTNLKGIDAAEFPIFPNASDDHVAVMDAAAFRQMINQVVFAAATDESRPTLTGVSTRLEKGRLTMAATDGFRLSVRSVDLGKDTGAPVQVIIPARALQEVSRIIGLLPSDGEQTVTVSVIEERNQVLFSMPDVALVTQLIDANFPSYEAIIPKAHATRTVIDTQPLLRALKLATLFSRDSNNMVRFQIAPGANGAPGMLTMTSQSSESGDNLANLDVAVEGPEAEIAFNGRYVIDLLNVVDHPQITLETTRASAPGVVRPVGVGPDEFTCVVMPMHLNR